MTTVIREFARASAGEVGWIASGVFSSGALLTAVRNGSDDLELIVWVADAVGRSLTRGRDSGHQAGEVGGIALAMMGERCITAVQNADGNLLLIPWVLESDGTIARLEYADNQAGKASYLAIMPLSDSLAVTPVRNGAGNLLIIPWRLESDGRISRLDDGPGQGGSVAGGSTSYRAPGSTQGAVPLALEGAMIAGAAIDPSNFVTAKVNRSGGLELAGWSLNAANQPTQWAATGVVAPLADFLCLAPLGDAQGHLVLAYRAITPLQVGVNVVGFQRAVMVSVWKPSTVDGSLRMVAEAPVDVLGDVSLAVGSIGPAGRRLIFLSGRSGHDLLVNQTIEVIENDDRLALVPSGRQDDASFGNIAVISPVALGSGQFVTTLGEDDGLALVAYRLSELSSMLLRPLTEVMADDAKALRLQALNNAQALTASVGASGNLLLIGWHLAAHDFAVTRAADTQAHPVAAQEVALVLRGQRAVTAIRSGSGNLRLDSWNIAPDLSSIAWVHETGSAAGGADLVTATLLEPDLIVTAVRNLSGNLLLIVWRLEPDGILSRLNDEDAQAGEIDLIALTKLDNANVVTSVRDGSGNLLLIGWHIAFDGTVTRWEQDGHAGEVKEIAAAELDGAGSTLNVVTAVRDGSDGLLLIVWRAAVDHRTITRLADSGDQGHGDNTASDIAVCICPTLPDQRPAIVTARRRRNRNLKLITWQLLDDAFGVPQLVETGEMSNRGDIDDRLMDLCALEPGRFAIAARAQRKHDQGLWLATMRLDDAQISPAPAHLLTLIDYLNPPPPSGEHWADSHGGTYPSDKAFEWEQVFDPNNEYDETPVAVSGWIVKPEESGADVPFSHPFGFDWEFGIAVDSGFEPFVSAANVNKEEEDDSPNANGIALADQLGLTKPEGLLGLEWEKDLLPWSYRGQVNHGDRVAVVGRLILDNGHDVDGEFRSEIHPPLLLASANAVRPADGSPPRTRALFISRPYLSGQTYTTNLATRYRDGVDDDGALLNPHFDSHGFNQLIKVLTFRSTQIEMHSKIKQQPFRGNHSTSFMVHPLTPRPGRGAQLMVSYRFNVRPPCSVTLERATDGDGVGIKVTVNLVETAADGRSYQAPPLPVSREEYYSTDELDLLSPGSGGSIAFGEGLIEFVSLLFISGIYALYLKAIFDNGIKTDVFDAQPQFDILNRNGGVAGVQANQIIPGAGVVEGDRFVYPVTGWIEVYWSTPTTG